jgi:uncharacterized protein YceH (UPF0502 family)
VGWEARRNGKLYYYEAERAGGRVVKRYVPPLVAGAVAAIAEDRREMRQAAAEANRAARAEAAALDDRLADLNAAADLLAEAALLAAGYRRHNRGEWRKRRGRRDETDPG